MGTDLHKLLRALIAMDTIHPFGDATYDIRERECKGWEGPKVKIWSGGCKVIDEMFAKYKDRLGSSTSSTEGPLSAGSEEGSSQESGQPGTSGPTSTTSTT